MLELQPQLEPMSVVGVTARIAIRMLIIPAGYRAHGCLVCECASTTERRGAAAWHLRHTCVLLCVRAGKLKSGPGRAHWARPDSALGGGNSSGRLFAGEAIPGDDFRVHVKRTSPCARVAAKGGNDAKTKHESRLGEWYSV